MEPTEQPDCGPQCGPLLQDLIEGEEWFHGRLGREQAETLLSCSGDFLVRESCSTSSQYVLSGMEGHTVKHLLLVHPNGQCWDRSFQEATCNRTPANGCPFHLVDTCQRPQCNPTCPALVDRATQQEMTLVQMLVAMGLDIQRLGLDPRREASPPADTNSKGG
ncbi:hypothetical protein CRUP_000461 [Coryphaenoides rupestris]|nr:hypothetical protein CRUP_000461 [Coryphaenoides rupestris]